MQKLLILITCTLVFSACDKTRKSFSDYLRNKRIDTYLESKDQKYRDAYRNMAMYSINDGNFYLTYYWKKEVFQKAFTTKPCEKKDTQTIDIQGRAFDRFHKIIDYAIKNQFDAFKFKDDSKAIEAKVRFYNCNPTTEPK